MGRTNASKNVRGSVTANEDMYRGNYVVPESDLNFQKQVENDVEKSFDSVSNMKNYVFSPYLSEESRAQYFGEYARNNQDIWKYMKANKEVSQQYHNLAFKNLKNIKFSNDINSVISDIKKLNNENKFTINPMRLTAISEASSVLKKSKSEPVEFAIYPEAYGKERVAVRGKNIEQLRGMEKNLAKLQENFNFAIRNGYLTTKQTEVIRNKLSSAVFKLDTVTQAYYKKMRPAAYKAFMAHEKTPAAKRDFDRFAFGQYETDPFILSGQVD
jgi:hypothetical protein